MIRVAAQAVVCSCAPRSTTEVHSRISDLPPAVSAHPHGFVLPELDHAAAVRAGNVEDRVRRPVSLILSRASRHEGSQLQTASRFYRSAAKTPWALTLLLSGLLKPEPEPVIVAVIGHAGIPRRRTSSAKSASQRCGATGPSGTYARSATSEQHHRPIRRNRAQPGSRRASGGRSTYHPSSREVYGAGNGNGLGLGTGKGHDLSLAAHADRWPLRQR